MQTCIEEEAVPYRVDSHPPPPRRREGDPAAIVVGKPLLFVREGEDVSSFETMPQSKALAGFSSFVTTQRPSRLRTRSVKTLLSCLSGMTGFGYRRSRYSPRLILVKAVIKRPVNYTWTDPSATIK